jgi:hypothetical protein
MVTPMTDEERQRAKERAMANKERSSEAADWRSQSDEMTDTTHEAPEQIWAGNWLADLGQGPWDMGEWRNCDWPSEGYKTVEYVRADLVNAEWRDAIALMTGIVDDCLLVDAQGKIVDFEYTDFQMRIAAIRKGRE